MTNMLQDGALWMGQQLQQHAGSVVTITQGTTVLAEISATLCQHEHDVIDDSNFMTRITAFDWTIVADDLEGLTLRKGATITDEAGTVYEAMPLGKKPAVERLDSSGVLLLVHTKKVKDGN